MSDWGVRCPACGTQPRFCPTCGGRCCACYHDDEGQADRIENGDQP